MKPTLYEALGLSQTAAESEIKAALRRLVRRYYAKTRAGHADVEEALRFLNHASHILGNPARRAEYDAELAESVRTETTVTTVGGPLKSDGIAAATTATEDDASISLLEPPRDKAPATIALAPDWSSQLSDIRRTRAGQLAGLLIVSLVFILVWQFALPAGSAVSTLKFALVILIFVLGAAAAVFVVVHTLSRSIWRPPVPEGAITLVEGMIPRWRRDRTVFMGTGAPVEDATWLFRLRMAELKRVSAERVSDPQPEMRLFARLFDYSMWGITVFAVLSLLASLGAVPVAVDGFLSHPLLAPIWVTATWIPIEAFLLTRIQTTPGRWLLGVYLHYEVSNPYAPEELRFTFGAALRRAADVWWRGCGAGLPVVAMVAMARAREHVSRSGETKWDSERDCLVTHGPVGSLSLAALVLGLAACALVLAARWKEPVQVMAENGRQGWTAMTERFESARAPLTAPVAAVAPSRVSRIDDMAAPSAPDAAATGASPAARLPSPPPRMQPNLTSVPAAPERPSAAPVPQKQQSPAAPIVAPSEPELSPMEQRDRRMAAYMRQAQRQQAAGDLAGMAKTCQRWADEDWRNPRAFYCAGLGLQGIGQHKQAIAMFNKAGALVPRDDPLKTLLGDAVLKSFRAESGG